MERDRVEGEERELTGVTRSQHVLHVLPQDAAAIPQFLDPLLERVNADGDALQLLVLTPDADIALAVAASSTRTDAGLLVPAVPVTSARRAARLVRGAPVVAGTPTELLELVRGTAIKLDQVEMVVIAWADTLLASTDEGTLQSLLSEVPRGATRVVVASEVTPAVEDFVERHARRARRVGDVSVTTPAPLELRYTVVPAEGRKRALHRILDTMDPEQCAIYVRSDDLEPEVRSLVRALGYRDEGVVSVTRGEPRAGASLVLYQLPPSREELRRLAAEAKEVIALVQPRQLGAVRALAAGGAVRPLQLPGVAAGARQREEQVRAELRDALADGAPARELLALEPLLEEFDGAELAAAALAILERERGSRAGSPRAVADMEDGRMVRIFISAGARDSIAARDLVGAIANEAGIPGGRIGKVDVRDTHSLVELPADVAEEATRRLTGTVLRGRRLQARVDAERPRREGGTRPAAGGARGGRGGDRPDRGGDRPDRGRSERGQGDARRRPEGRGRPRPEGRERPARPSRPRE